MKFNGATFNKAQQDQLKRAIENKGDGGMTLNKYTYSGTSAQKLNRIMTSAKSVSAVSINGQNVAIASIPNSPDATEFYGI